MSEIQETLVQDGEMPCRDPECGGLAEVEIDGDHRYFECQECGFAFGYERIGISVQADNCAVGVPETLRRAASQGMERAIEQERRSQPPLIQLRRPE